MRQLLWVALALFALTILTYFNGLHGEFMIDDKLFRSKYYNAGFLNFSDFFLKTPNWHYIPINYILNLSLFNRLPDNPFYFHLFNLSLFFLCGLSVYVLVTRLTANKTLAFLTSALFLIHPTNAEIVTHIHLDIVLLCFFLMSLSLLCFLNYLEQPRFRSTYFTFSLTLFAVSLLCFEGAILFTLYLGTILYFNKRFEFRKVLILCLPFVVMSLIYFCIQFKIAGKNAHFMVQDRDLHLNFFSVVATLFQLVKWYIGNLILPGSTALFKHFFPIQDPYGFYTILTFMLIALSLTLMFKFWKPDSRSWALAWFLIGFIIVFPASFIHSSMGLVIEPYWFFFPIVGFFILLSDILLKLRNRLGLRIWCGLMAGLLLFFVIHSWRINIYARKERTYCEYWLTSDPGNPIPLGTISDEFVAQKEYLQALSIDQKTLDSNTVQPTFVYEKMARTCMQMGDFKKAREYALLSMKAGRNKASMEMLGVMTAIEGSPKPTSGSNIYQCTVMPNGETTCKAVSEPFLQKRFSH